MKRIHLFEFEDQNWFPSWLRTCMMRLITVMHKILKSKRKIAALAADVLKETPSSTIVDLCSGSGGPMPDVLQILQKEYGFTDIDLILSDLYPDLKVARNFNRHSNKILYREHPIDATTFNDDINGLRTMIGSFHHMRPDDAKKILASAQKNQQPILIFEISDNSTPIWLWWIALPVNFVMTFFITVLVRPITWQQIFFTYIIPIIPLCFAWDGAVSNARTYTLSDLDELLGNLRSKNYRWEKDILKGKTNQIYLIGLPK